MSAHRVIRTRAAALLTCVLAVGMLPSVSATGRSAPTGTVPSGAAITVTTTRDELNRDGDCSLREAIQAANTDARVDRCAAGDGRDRVLVPAGTFKLTRIGAREGDNRTGDLDIRRSVTIEGKGPGATILDGQAADRLLDVFDPSAVTVIGVTLRNGAPGAGRRGGAVVVLDGASLILRGVVVEDNTTRDGPDRFPDGGGIYNDGVLRLIDSVVRDNVAGGFEGSGGGIWSSGRLTLVRTTVSGNRAAGRQPASHDIDGGGGIYSGDTLVITDSTISGNRSTYRGGGISNEGTMSITDSAVDGNTAGASGGGIQNAGGSIGLVGTSVTANTAGQAGGGIRNLPNGAVTLDAGSSVSGNAPDDCFGTAAC